MATQTFNLAAAAHAEMLRDGFHPDFTADIQQQVDQVRQSESARLETPGTTDLRTLLWSSIDNDTSRDLDQIEWVEQTPAGIRVLIGIADVNSAVPKDSPMDTHAARETTSVYTAAQVFPMLPNEMSTDLTSLNEGEDRLAVVVEFTVNTAQPDSICDVATLLLAPRAYRAVVHNRAQLAYNSLGAWLEGRAAAPPKVAASPELQAQLRLQDEAAQILRHHRVLCGALEFERPEAQATAQVGGTQITDITATPRSRANDLIEDFMIAANELMARTLQAAGRSSIRRVVRTPKNWDRIVALAQQHGVTLPTEPDSGELNKFLVAQKAADPLHYPDLSLSVIKLMGPGIYILTNPKDPDQAHFGLAARDYTHSTAPNRRFADVITQRVVQAMLANQPAPYTDDELTALADHCTLMEDNARKVERTTLKMAAAVALQSHVGQTYSAVVTGASDKGTYVRIPDPPVEGRVMQNEQGLGVGDQVKVKLLHTNPQRGFLDFSALRT
jgi:VacB/RNase II family 3'-5' exoribonuclease